MVKSVLSFSPGEYMLDKHSVGRAAQYLPQPIFITSANDPKEIAAAQAIAARVPDDRATFFTPPEGAIHGSSTLRSEEHTSELQSLMRISYAVFCLKKKNIKHIQSQYPTTYISRHEHIN